MTRNLTSDRRRTSRERRVHARVPAVFAVKAVLRGRLELGQAEDVAEGGMALRRPNDLALPAGTGVVLTFALPGDGTLLRLSALVVSDRATGSFRRTGLRFVALAADQQQQVRSFCRAITRLEYPTASVA
jgi:c-di-GMP-binding flagellar brake protein YcgR